MNQEPNKTESNSQAAPVSIPEVKVPQVTISKDEVQRFFNEATKYTIFGIFILYSIGFLIWHSYLAEYGVSSFEFLQAEYFSATICYLIFVTMFALPAALLYVVILEKKKLGNVDANTIIFIWYTISYQFLLRFFPSYMANQSNKLMNGILIITALMFIYVILFVFLTINVHFKWTIKWGWKYDPETMRNLVQKLNLVTICILAIGVIYCFSIPELSKSFLLFSLLLYPTLAYGFEMGNRNLWNEGGNAVKILIATFCILVIIGNIQVFGVAQFGRISRQMGGGKAEKAYIKFAPQYSDLPTLLNIPIVTKTDSLNGFSGPIEILMRTDNQLIFLTPTKPSALDFSTNDISIKPVMTNSLTSFVANLTTNQLPQTITNLSKAVTDTTKTATKPMIETMAKQVRANLVDAIIFVK